VDIQVKDAFQTPNRHNYKRNSPHHFIFKVSSLEKIERILKVAGEKHQYSYKVKNITTTSVLPAEILKSRKEWNDILQMMKENNCQPKFLYPVKVIMHN
jgi:hypothetical protein